MTTGSPATVWQGPAGTVPVVNGNGNIFEEVQVAIAGQTVFNLLTFQYTPGTHSIFVYRKSGGIGGQMLRRNVDYTETSNGVITLAVGATAGDLLIFIAIAINQLLTPPIANGMPAGGLAGQVLSKINGSDYNVQWVALAALGTLLDAQRINIPSASTVDLTPQATVTRNIQITGNTQIDGFAIANGELYAVVFQSALTLKNNVSIITQRGVDIAVTAGATCFIRAVADNIVEILCYVEAVVSDVSTSTINTGQIAGTRNKIINGKMDIAQRGTNFPAIATSAYSLDRWVFGNGSAAVVTVSQQADAPSAEFQNSLRLAVTTADAAIAAGDFAFQTQRIEGFNVRDLVGKPFTISFWVRSAKAGIHCIALRNSTSDRSYIAEYTVNVANTWEKKSITIAAGLITAGTWNFNSGLGLDLSFVLASGVTFQTAANAWQVGNFLATANQVNCLDTVGNIFALTGVQVEVGNRATAFEHRLFNIEFTSCQRYYEKSYQLSSPPGTAVIDGAHQTVAASSFIMNAGSSRFSVNKRALPAIILFSPQTGGSSGVAEYNAGGVFVADRASTIAGAGTSGFEFQVAGTATVGNNIRAHWTANAEL